MLFRARKFYAIRTKCTNIYYENIKIQMIWAWQVQA